VFELPLQIFDRGRQNADAFDRDLRASFRDHRLIAIAHGVRNDNDRKADVPYALGRHLGKRRKSGTDDGDRRDSQIFERGRVTRGPGG
jgi:hypothetical protein